MIYDVVLSLWQHCFASATATLVVVSTYQIESACQISDRQGESVTSTFRIKSVV